MAEAPYRIPDEITRIVQAGISISITDSANNLTSFMTADKPPWLLLADKLDPVY